MPQLDTLTFFSQALTLFVLITLMFIFVSTVLLPALFRIQKIRVFFCSKTSLTDTIYTKALFNLLQLKNFIIVSSLSDSADVVESLGSELQAIDVLFDFDDILAELSAELCQFQFDRFLMFEELESEGVEIVSDVDRLHFFEFDEEFDEFEEDE